MSLEEFVLRLHHSSTLDCLLFTQPPLKVSHHRVKALLVFVYLITTVIIFIWNSYTKHVEIKFEKIF